MVQKQRHIGLALPGCLSRHMYLLLLLLLVLRALEPNWQLDHQLSSLLRPQHGRKITGLLSLRKLKRQNYILNFIMQA